MSWLSRALNVFRAGRVGDELDEELAFHVESRARDLEAAGLPREDALRQARRRLGNPVLLRERSLDVKLLATLDAVIGDLRTGVRKLRRDRVVTAAAVVSLALAIGGCTAAFALVDALILRPLSVRDPDTLIALAIFEGRDRNRTSFNYPLFRMCSEAALGRAELAAFGHQGVARGRVRSGGPERPRIRAVRLRQRVRHARHHASRRPPHRARRRCARAGPGRGRPVARLLDAAIRR